ncbi:hypothetical protein ACFQX7_00760 [Luedemannella flava]
MSPGDRAIFIAAYGRLVVEVWSDPAREALLERDPRQLLSEYGVTVPDDVTVTVRRDTGDAEPDLEAQVAAWRDAPPWASWSCSCRPSRSRARSRSTSRSWRTSSPASNPAPPAAAVLLHLTVSSAGPRRPTTARTAAIFVRRPSMLVASSSTATQHPK